MREYTSLEVKHLQHIVETHNPNDLCEKVVRDTALAALKGETELHPYGLLFLTNGASGYDRSIPFPENWEKTKEEILASFGGDGKI